MSFWQVFFAGLCTFSDCLTFNQLPKKKFSVAQIVFRCLAHSNKSFLIFLFSLSLNVNLIWRHRQSLLTRTTKKVKFFLHSRVHQNPFMLLLYDCRKAICKSSGNKLVSNLSALNDLMRTKPERKRSNRIFENKNYFLL